MASILDSFMVALGFQVDDSGLKKFEDRATSVRESAIGLADVVGSILTGAFTELFKNFVDTGAEFEKYNVVLGVLYDNVQQGKEATDWISDFAVKTPYQLADLTQAFIRLKAFGLDPTQGALRTVGDTAAAFGRPLMDAVFAMDDAIEGINRPLRTFGISVKTAGDKVTYSYIKNGKMISHTADKNNKLMIASTLQAIWNDRYGGAMDKLSYTWGGMMSNLYDQITRFKKKMMESGPFQQMKLVLGQIIDIVNKASSDGTVTKFAEAFDLGFQAVYRTAHGFWMLLNGIITRTVGWKVALSALAFVLGGILVSSLSHTLSMIYKLTSAMLAFDLSTVAVWGLAIAIGLLLEDIYGYFHGEQSLIGSLQKKYPIAFGIAVAAVGLLSAAFVALKLQALVSMVETAAIIAMYAVEWIAAFGSMAVATTAALWPVMLVIAALVVLAFGIYEVWKHWDKITGFMKKAWHEVKDAMMDCWDLFKQMSTTDKFKTVLGVITQNPALAGATMGLAEADRQSKLGASKAPTSPVNAGGGVLGNAGSSSTTSHHSTSTTEIHAPITVVSNDPHTAGQDVQRVLDKKRRQVVRNGQSAVAY